MEKSDRSENALLTCKIKDPRILTNVGQRQVDWVLHMHLRIVKAAASNGAVRNGYDDPAEARRSN